MKKHKENAISVVANNVKQLNLNLIPEYNLPITANYLHLDNFSYKKDNFAQKFVHEALSCVENKNLLNDVNISKEAKELANYYLKDITVGAYSDSNGIMKLRNNFIDKLHREYGIKGLTAKDLYFTNGSLSALEHILTLVFEKYDQILLPNPFYPFMLNLSRSKGIINLEYMLKDNDWSIDIDNISKVYSSNKSFFPIKALLISNPHEPTGKLYTKSQIEEVINFCYENKLALISWEVGCSSFLTKATQKEYKPTLQILQNMPEKIKNGTMLFTVFGLSRAIPNMSSLRTGLIISKNLDPFVATQLLKYKSIDLCSCVTSQIAFDIINSQDFQALFGKIFSEKYYNCIQHEKDIITKKKNDIFGILNKYPDIYKANDLDAGINLFLKFNYLSQSTFLKYYYSSFGKKHNNLVSPGKFYGTNRDNYINILINSHQDYSFLELNI